VGLHREWQIELLQDWQIELLQDWQQQQQQSGLQQEHWPPRLPTKLLTALERVLRWLSFYPLSSS
jgi:hypothetical protein